MNDIDYVTLIVKNKNGTSFEVSTKPADAYVTWEVIMSTLSQSMKKIVNNPYD